jgi:hypothetical protein
VLVLLNVGKLEECHNEYICIETMWPGIWDLACIILQRGDGPSHGPGPEVRPQVHHNARQVSNLYQSGFVCPEKGFKFDHMYQAGFMGPK